MTRSNDPVGAPRVVKRRMTSWFNPRPLARTGFHAFVSSVISGRVDARLLEDQNPGAPEAYPLDDRDALWFDYIADTGDGWNPTYAIASAVARGSLRVTDERGRPHETQRGSVAVLGGDQVYPRASRSEYRHRFEGPFSQALPARPPRDRPLLFALPGNHDWYDGLVAFRRLFMQRRSIGGWQTEQACSYWAVKLPHRWWLLGVDVQLDSDLDRKQIEYFRSIADQFEDRDGVILCTPEPYWVRAAESAAHGGKPADNNVRFFEDKVLRRRADVVIAGDIHHYRRQRDERGRPLITAGGGGAFLHPTHVPELGDLRRGCREIGAADDGDIGPPTREPVDDALPPDGTPVEYPDRNASRRAARGLWNPLLFTRTNPLFGVVTAVIYWLTATVFARPLRDSIASSDGVLVALEFTGQLASAPSSLALALLLWFGLAAYARMGGAHGWPSALIVGLVHATAHAASALIASHGLHALAAGPLGLALGSGWDVVIQLGGLAATGYLVGPWIMGLYLYASLAAFRWHANEAFSALAIQDWKSFLRLHIDEDGRLTIYPIGIDRVPRKPAEREADEGGAGDDRAGRGREYEPRLVEPPIEIAPR